MQPMTETTNRYGIYAVDYTTFGGEITIEDFNTTLPNRKRITKQRYMINKSTQRKERQKYKNMTLEELRKMKALSDSMTTLAGSSLVS